MALLTRRASGGEGNVGCRRGFLRFGLLLLVVAWLPAAEPTPTPEYQLKAVFLFNFAQFVEWPAHAFGSSSAPLVIGVLGDDPFGAYLDNVVTGEKVGEHPLMIRRYRRDEDPDACHILFVSASETSRLGTVMARMKGRSILTVSDLDAFNRAGGMVRFVTESGKIRLRINVEAAKACELKISSKILRPATVVTQEKE